MAVDEVDISQFYAIYQNQPLRSSRDLGPGEGAIGDPFYLHAQAGVPTQAYPFFLIEWDANTSQGS